LSKNKISLWGETSSDNGVNSFKFTNAKEKGARFINADPFFVIFKEGLKFLKGANWAIALSKGVKFLLMAPGSEAHIF